MVILMLSKNNVFSISSLRSLHKYLYDMNKAYLRHSVEGDKFDISFQFADPQIHVDRKFNFTRNLDETVSSFLKRLTINVEKVIQKANKKKKALQNVVDVPAVTISLCLNQVLVNSDVPCKEIFCENNNVTLKLFDKEYQVVINAPYVDNIALPSSILATFPVYPLKFESVYVDEDSSSFTWYKSSDKKKWEIIGDGFVFIPGNDTVDNYLKLVCIPRNLQDEGPTIEVVSDTVVSASPGTCPFERRHEFTNKRTRTNEFRVVTYNILADLYCDSDFTRTVLHPYCPEYALAIDYRKQLFLKEIIGYNSDIICLQEVDRKVYSHDLQPVLSKLNYGSEFALKGGQVAEGLACFYNNNKFRLLSSAKTILAEELENDPIYKDFNQAISSNGKLKERFVDRQTAVLVATLECLATENIVIVANTHLYFHPDADHIRLLQGAMAMKCVEEAYKKTKGNNKDKNVAIVFCGDFNSSPDCGIYKLFTDGYVEPDFKDWSSNKEEAVKDFCVKQPFKMKSACGTPQYTNYTVGFADCLDYIYYDTTTVEVSQSVPLPTHDELILHTALPSVVFPSDHISLCADLKWK